MHKVSIIIPCYKQAEYLSESLNSVHNQTYQDWECIVVNDGSPDNTKDIAQKYLDKDPRFKYVWKENEGVSSARNYGIKKSMGEFILPLDADDIIDSTYIAKAVERFLTFPNTKLVYCKAKTFGRVNGLWDLEEYNYEEFIWSNSIFCTAMFRREDYDRTNGYNANMIFGNEDWDFWLSLLKKEDVVYRIDEYLFYYRTSPKSRTTELAKNHVELSLMQICRNHPDIYSSHFDKIIEYHNLAEEALVYRQQLKNVLQSNAFKIGKILLKPNNWIKNNVICCHLFKKK